MRNFLLILIVLIGGCANQTQKHLREAAARIGQANTHLAVIDTNATEIQSAAEVGDVERIPPLTENIRKETNAVRVLHTEAAKSLGKGSDSAAKEHDKYMQQQNDLLGPVGKKIVWGAAIGTALFFMLTRTSVFSLGSGVFAWLTRIVKRK